MPQYRYRAVAQNGKNIKGAMVAADEAQLHRLLQQQGKYLIQAETVQEKGHCRALTAKELSEFSRELGIMLNAGITLVRALSILSEEESVKSGIRKLYKKILERVCQGQTLAEAAKGQQEVFPPAVIQMFQAAEIAGNLGQASLQLAEYYGREYRLEAKIKNALIYPKFLMVTAVAVVAFLTAFVLPQFQSLFDMMETLPLPTRILYGITDFLRAYWYLAAAGIIGAGLAVRLAGKISPIRRRLDWLKVHMPVFGTMQQAAYTARFARTLSSLYISGIGADLALQIAGKTVGNSYIEAQIDKAAARVRGGRRISEGLGSIDGLLKKLSSAIQVGEETGNLDTLLLSMADSLDYEAELAAGRMVSCLEPLMVIVMAVVIGGIMAAVIIPIYESYHVIEQTGF